MKALIRMRMGSRDAHYGGGLVDGAKLLELFGDVATELCVRDAGDEGLFRAYESVEFLRPVRAGDFVEAEGEIVGWGRTSLKMEFVARKVIAPVSGSPSAADALAAAEVVCRARGTCVVPEASRRAVPAGLGGRPGPCILTAAIVGAETTRAQNPHLPITADELGEEARRSVAAGVAVIHLHVRHDDGRPSQDRELFRKAIRAIRARTADLGGVIVQTSTGGAVGMSVDERAGPLELEGADAPEMATLNVGTINFGDEVFENAAPKVIEMAKRIRARGVTPEVEIYDAGHLDIAADLVRQGLLDTPVHFQFVLGVRGAMAASARNLDFLAAGVPRGSTWGVAGIGRHQLPLADLAILKGGNVRVGLEDNVYLAKGVLAEGSAPLVAKAAEMVRARGRAVATVAEARRILGVPAR